MLTSKLKYYWFDWDDNLKFMPTNIYLLVNGEEVWVSTKDFAELRHEIGKWKYELLPDWNSFRDFTELGDEQFRVDSLNADFWPSWIEFEKCINNARIFSIITARGHSSNSILWTVEEMILKWHWGLNVSDVASNMFSYMELAKQKDSSVEMIYDEKALVEKYLSLARIYPVSNIREMSELWINASVVSPEKAKQTALKHFADHVLDKVDKIVTDLYERPVIKIWFSDDDVANIEWMRSFIENGWIGDQIVPYLYDTSWKSLNRVL